MSQEQIHDSPTGWVNEHIRMYVEKYPMFARRYKY